eukprot:g3744.t1
MHAALRGGGDTNVRFEYITRPKAEDLKEGEYVVDIRASAINPVDYKVGKSILGPIYGIDFAGVVKHVGPPASSGSPPFFRVGDKVFGAASGSLTEETVIQEKRMAKMPSSLSFVEAAALPVAYLTGLQGLRDHGNMKKGSRVLVVGASGGCGTAAVQIAKALGAQHIVGVCSAKNDTLVRSLGADDVVDYKKEDFAEKYADAPEKSKFDVVYDAATGSGGGELYKSKSISVLAAGGQYVALNGSGMAWTRMFLGLQEKNVHLFLTKQNRADLGTLAKIMDEHKLKPIIAITLSFSRVSVNKGFQALKGRRTVGKIVFDHSICGESSISKSPTKT